jgi:hypothetical protein
MTEMLGEIGDSATREKRVEEAGGRSESRDGEEEEEADEAEDIGDRLGTFDTSEIGVIGATESASSMMRIPLLSTGI